MLQKRTKLVTADLSLLKRSQKRPYFSERKDRSNVLCFSTSLSYEGQIKKVLSEYTPPHPKVGRRRAVQEQWEAFDIGWGRIPGQPYAPRVTTSCDPFGGD